MAPLMLYICAVLINVSCTEATHVRYDYEIVSDGHSFEGFVLPEVVKGERISISKEEDSVIMKGADEVKYLKLKVLKGNTKSMTDKVFVVADTDGIAVDVDGYLVVNNTKVFDSDKEVDFYVVLVRRPDNIIISNPVPFVVRMEERISETSESSYEPAAAIFAGTLILVIVVFALLIPFVVRAKRRYRDGKPVFKPGSYPSIPNVKRQQIFSQASREPNWYGNTGFNYDDEVEKEKSDFTENILRLSQKRKNSANSWRSNDNVNEEKKTTSKVIEENSKTTEDGPAKGILKNSWTLSSLNEKDESKEQVYEESKL